MYILGIDGGVMIQMRYIGTQSLLEAAYKPDVVEQYCLQCPNYESNFSCPSHDFSTGLYLQRYPSALLIMHTLPAIPGVDPLEDFFSYREQIDPVLMTFERLFFGEALLPGCCHNCSDDCSALDAQACLNPTVRRYSLESLGVDINSMLEYYFDTTLTFQDERLVFVYGFFLKDSPDPILLTELESELQSIEC
jgi:predicted metal-binding protein